MLRLDDFNNSTAIKPFVAFELADEDRLRSAKQPAQLRNEVRMKPQSKGHESLMQVLADFK